ncbi:MAG: pyridoxal phosphate-dependent aminotransferase [Acidobacteria bacterium]|nr:MAG: pyridoxal phosphate-dependent aminotransferase [Acidobacteriota bacterium]
MLFATLTDVTLTHTDRLFALSGRARRMPRSPIRKLVPLADAAKARGTKVYHLNIGQPDIETPACMRDRLKQMDARVLEYSPSAGTPEFLRSLQRYYERRLGISLELNQVLATTGGSEAILFSLIACADQGDDLMVVEPFYANYIAFATMAGLNIVPVTSRGRDGFHLPPREVWEATMTPRSRVVILCNPNNPTGTVYTREELDVVAGFCRDHGLFLISDEVYREFVYDGRRAISALELHGCEDFAIVVDSLSKRYSACGIRLGSLVTRNPEIYDACLRMAQGRLSPPGLAQFIAIGADALGEEYTRDVVAEYQRRRDVLFEGLTAIPGVFLQKPEGAFYCVAKLPVDDAEHFAAWLLTDFQHQGATVMVAPANGFYASPLGVSEVRIAYVLNVADLRTSIRILDTALRKYSG